MLSELHARWEQLLRTKEEEDEDDGDDADADRLVENMMLHATSRDYLEVSLSPKGIRDPSIRLRQTCFLGFSFRVPHLGPLTGLLTNFFDILPITLGLLFSLFF